MERGLFITVEGTDGSGKSTHIKLMDEYLRGKGYEVVLTREPGGTNISEKIRAIVLDSVNAEMGWTTEMLLYAAARSQLVTEIIRPSIEKGKIVICDRFIDSTYAYQGFGRGIDLKVLAEINRVAVDGVMPDITFFFDVNPEIALRRRLSASEPDRIEREKMEFHMKVYNGYRKLAMLYPERITSIDSSKDIDTVSMNIQNYLDKMLV